MSYDSLMTEQINPDTVDIDLCNTTDIVKMIHTEDEKVASAIEAVLPQVALAVDVITDKIREGGRLLYIGAGTSGRLGVLDASECPPTFGVDPKLVVGIIAGGEEALRSAVEGAEDLAQQGSIDIKAHHVCDKDVVVGITASGCAPYVLGALVQARKKGAATIAVSNTSPAEISQLADISILALVGPEVIMGSTRMKAGTSQKMIFNMLTTATMIKLGKTYQNLMVDLTPTNKKLQDRVIRIIMKATDASHQSVEKVFDASGNKPKTTIVMLLTGCSMEQAEKALEEGNGIIRKAVRVIKGIV